MYGEDYFDQFNKRPEPRPCDLPSYEEQVRAKIAKVDTLAQTDVRLARKYLKEQQSKRRKKKQKKKPTFRLF
jgi:predicted transcriptional regulator